MDFGEAIKALKEGKKVARKGWNGKGMYLYLVEGRVLAQKIGYGNYPFSDSIIMKTQITNYALAGLQVREIYSRRIGR